MNTVYNCIGLYYLLLLSIANILLWNSLSIKLHETKIGVKILEIAFGGVDSSSCTPENSFATQEQDLTRDKLPILHSELHTETIL